MLIDGEYRSIKPGKNCIVVNLGKIFERITNYKLKATFHRVLDIGVERYSSPFFMEPKYTAVIPSNLINPEQEGTEIVYGPWLIKRMCRLYKEWHGFLELSGIELD